MARVSDCYCKQWKDPSDHSKGTVWTYMTSDAFKQAGIPRLEEGMGCWTRGIRHRECMRGTKWKATWADGTTFTIRSSPQVTKPSMASIAQRWHNPPLTLKKESGQPFTVEHLEKRTDSFVYFVRLLTFEETANGARYFKIGKATSIPSRIKQFGPCELIVHEVHTDSQAALKREKELHKQFAAYRRPETEIFLLGPMEVLQVRMSMNGS